jgi:hypothetical protein
MPQLLFSYGWNGGEKRGDGVESPRALDSMGSPRSSLLTAFAPAVLAAPVFVESAAPFSPARWRFSGQSSLK